MIVLLGLVPVALFAALLTQINKKSIETRRCAVCGHKVIEQARCPECGERYHYWGFEPSL